jgi:hypothetical protein
MQIKNAGVGRHLFYVLQISQSAKRGSDLMLVTDKQGRLQHVTQVCSCLHRPLDPKSQGPPEQQLTASLVIGIVSLVIGHVHGPVVYTNLTWGITLPAAHFVWMQCAMLLLNRT